MAYPIYKLNQRPIIIKHHLNCMENYATNGQGGLTNATKKIISTNHPGNEQPPVKVKLALKRWLDKQDVMREFYVSERTLYNWRKKKLIPFGNIGRKFYYDRRLIEGLLSKGRDN